MEWTLRCTLGSQAQHAHSWKTIHGLSNRAPTLNTSIIFSNKIATTPQTHCELFHQTIHKHATHKTNRYTNRATHKIQGYNITLTTTQVQEAIKQGKNNNSQCPDKLTIRHLKHIGPLGLAFLTCMLKIALNTNIIPHIWNLDNTQVQEAIKQSKNNNSQCPDKLNIRHLKHIGPLGLAFLTSMLKTALNTNIIPHIWNLANIVPISKLNKDIDKGTSYWPISLISVIAKTLEKSLLPYITANIPNTPTQHGYKTLYSDGTAHSKQNRSKGIQPNGPPLPEQSV